jgi:hypothetical protein
MHSYRLEFLAVIDLQAAVSDRTKAMRLLQDRVEHRCEVAGRRIDDLQHLCSRGLPLQRFARLGQEPRVFDRDDCLVGEGGYELDLPVGKRPHLRPT